MADLLWWPRGDQRIGQSIFALKLCGCRRTNRSCAGKRADSGHGRCLQANVFTKITLALFDQYDWEGVPHMPVELMLLPKKFYFSIYAISYWSRAVLIPLLIVFAHRPVCRIPAELGIDELYPIPRQEVRYWKYPPFNKDQAWFTPHNFFVAVDVMLKLYDRMPMRVLREKALHKAACWMVDHLKGAGGLGAIYPAMANSIMALQCLGYDADDPLVVKALREIEALEVYDSAMVDGESVPTLHLQPCFSPIWDTALLMNALVEAGVSQDHPALQKQVGIS